jgi:hypothetical protein
VASSSCATLLVTRVGDIVLILMWEYGELMVRIVGEVVVTALVLP